MSGAALEEHRIDDHLDQNHAPAPLELSATSGLMVSQKLWNASLYPLVSQPRADRGVVETLGEPREIFSTWSPFVP
jgi:hypothetical protein